MKCIKLKIVLLLIIFCSNVLGQQLKMDLFSIKSSTLIDDLIQKKSENSKITANDLAAFGNEIISNSGVNYQFELSENNCKTFSENQQKLKLNQKMPAFQEKFNQPQGEPITVLLPQVNFINNCGCYLNIPSLNVIETEFVTKIRDQNIKFIRPSNFKHTVELVDNTEFTKTIRRWFIPFPTTPAGIYEDGTILFLELQNNELTDLAFAIYENGTIQIVSKKDWDLTEKSTPFKVFSPNTGNLNLNFISFGEGIKKRVLKFNSPCK